MIRPARRKNARSDRINPVNAGIGEFQKQPVTGVPAPVGSIDGRPPRPHTGSIFQTDALQKSAAPYGWLFPPPFHAEDRFIVPFRRTFHRDEKLARLCCPDLRRGNNEIHHAFFQITTKNRLAVFRRGSTDKLTVANRRYFPVRGNGTGCAGMRRDFHRDGLFRLKQFAGRQFNSERHDPGQDQSGKTSFPKNHVHEAPFQQ